MKTSNFWIKIPSVWLSVCILSVYILLYNNPFCLSVCLSVCISSVCISSVCISSVCISSVCISSVCTYILCLYIFCLYIFCLYIFCKIILSVGLLDWPQLCLTLTLFCANLGWRGRTKKVWKVKKLKNYEKHKIHF